MLKGREPFFSRLFCCADLYFFALMYICGGRGPIWACVEPQSMLQPGLFSVFEVKSCVPHAHIWQQVSELQRNMVIRVREAKVHPHQNGRNRVFSECLTWKLPFFCHVAVWSVVGSSGTFPSRVWFLARRDEELRFVSVFILNTEKKCKEAL